MDLQLKPIHFLASCGIIGILQTLGIIGYIQKIVTG